ncbi:PKD domain-containing protein [Alteromonas ponticola]|uniref:PKD domain-containing protein n=1 Tax=Alteromonas aquimaris TaxID=2998417 RepID=A0ABT3P2J4_9ALTE|nr:hypothetical protein [Alteromonas aquimaris]MCW8106975.1 PKD domain-containing protein [Alteromonas aquimaris]
MNIGLCSVEIHYVWTGFAYDAVDGVTEVRFESDALLRTGTHTVNVIAEDSSGNVARRTVEVSIYPSIQVGSKMHAEAGAQVDMMFALSGLPPVYPVEFDYRISYPDGSSEYYYDSIHEGQTSIQRIAIPPTSLPGEQIEVELLWVYNTHINYSSSKMKIEVIDDNRPPRLQLSAFQNGGAVTAIDKSAGNVILEVKWSDINVNDEIQIVNGSANTEIYEISSTSHSVIFELNPLELDTFLEAEFSIAEKNTAEKYGATSSIELMVRDSLPTLGHGDSDNDGISDFEEGVFDDDRDGIPNYLDSNNVPNRLPMASGERDIVTESGLTFSLGNVVIRNFGSNAANATIGIESLFSEAVSSIPNYTATDENAALQPINFKVSGLVTNGDTVNVVIPLNKPIAAGMGVRKFSRADGWYNFVEDEHNALYSSNLDSDGNCPSIGSTMYASGLQEGAECLLLSIEDGGPNDTDGVQNGEVEDPVYVAAIASSSPTAKLDGPATVKEGQSFHLDANGSSDPDGDMLSFRWEQLEGPQLALENPTASRLRLIAPDVTEDSTMQFRVTVSDGHSSHTAMLRVTVTNHADDSDETGGTQDPVTPPAVSNQNPTKPPASASGGGGTFDYIWYLLMFITMCIRNVRNNDIRLTRVEN